MAYPLIYKRLLVEVTLMRLCTLNNELAEKKSPIINIPLKKEGKKAVTTINPVQTHTKTSEKFAAKAYVLEKETVAMVKEALPEKINKIEQKEVVLSKVLPKVPLNFSENISILPREEVKEEVLEQEIGNRPNKLFTQEEFYKKWDEFKNQLLKKGELNFACIFDEKPIVEGNLIKSFVDNNTLADEFKRRKMEVIDFFREQLSNYDIDINVEVNQDVRIKKAYTPQEKYIKMVEKNPTLKILRQKLDMDIDYA